MVSDEELFGKRDERKDDIKPLIEEMDKFSDNQEYEKAKDVLDRIKEKLKKSSVGIWISVRNLQTIEDAHNLVTSESIRLSPDNYKFSDFLGLLVNVHKRKDEIQGARYIDIDKQRKVVAEEMACLGMTVHESRSKVGRSRKPNRAFLDIAHKVNPSICKTELERREKVMLWKAIESGDIKEIEKAKERLKKYSDRNYWHNKWHAILEELEEIYNMRRDKYVRSKKSKTVNKEMTVYEKVEFRSIILDERKY